MQKHAPGTCRRERLSNGRAARLNFMLAMNRKHFALLSAAFLAANGVAVIIFLASRPPLGPDSWSFLEQQRPRTTSTANGSETSFMMVADGLTFALARRPVGGWESRSFRAFQVVNLPAFVAALATFQSLQAMPGGTSKAHSDIATVVFGLVALAQWLALSFLLSVRSGRF